MSELDTLYITHGFHHTETSRYKTIAFYNMQHMAINHSRWGFNKFLDNPNKVVGG